MIGSISADLRLRGFRIVFMPVVWRLIDVFVGTRLASTTHTPAESPVDWPELPPESNTNVPEKLLDVASIEKSHTFDTVRGHVHVYMFLFDFFVSMFICSFRDMSFRVLK